MAGEYIIWSMPCGRRARVGASKADLSPLPFGADPIVRVDEFDLHLMLRWCRSRVKKGWTVERMRSACHE